MDLFSGSAYVLVGALTGTPIVSVNMGDVKQKHGASWPLPFHCAFATQLPLRHNGADPGRASCLQRTEDPADEERVVTIDEWIPDGA
jgi:hypothetical protein